MSDSVSFSIYVEQLKKGGEHQIEEFFAPDFLDINEPDLNFKHAVALKGVAYLVDQELIFFWDISTQASIPCSICNQMTQVPIEIKKSIHSVPLNDIPSGIYDFRELLRETILLEVPLFAECNRGKCPERQVAQHYLTDPSSGEKDVYRPFADLESLQP